MVYLEIFVIILLTMLNGLLAMSELAIVSSRKSRLQQMIKDGNKGAHSALQLLENPSRFLSTVQMGITLIGIIAGAFSGATIGHRLGLWLDSFPVISPYGDILGVGVTVIVITYLSVIMGELVPKRIAFAQPERTAASVARPMQVLSLIFTPAVWLLHISTEAVLRIFHISASRETIITEDEVKLLITEGTRAGVFAPQEKEMIDGVLRLADRPVRAIMTPHSKIIWLDSQSDRDIILETLDANRFSRILVCDGTLDKPMGVVNAKDLLPKAMTCADIKLADLITPLLYVPENMSILILLNQFKKEKVHVAAVIDEYGMTKGLITLTDVIEAVAGDLPELGEDITPEVTQRSDGSWLIDGMLPTDELESATGISMGKSLKILAGFAMEQLGHIPAVGESFHYGGYRFEIVDMDGNRIDKVLIQNTTVSKNPDQ
jgi:putative hemolysin